MIAQKLKSKIHSAFYLVALSTIFICSCTKSVTRENDNQCRYDTTLHENGAVKIIQAKKGKRGNGLFRRYYPNGIIELITTLKNGKVNGPKLQFYRSGEVEAVINLKEGMKYGESRFFYQNGMIETYRFWVNDTLLYKAKFDTNGSLTEEDGDGHILHGPGLMRINNFFVDSIELTMINPPTTTSILTIKQLDADSNSLQMDTFPCNGSVLTLHVEKAAEKPKYLDVTHILTYADGATQEISYWWVK